MLNIIASQGKELDIYNSSVMNKDDVVDPKACEPIQIKTVLFWLIIWWLILRTI